MIILLDTSTPVCKLTMVDGSAQWSDEWQADRTLAKGLLEYLQSQLQTRGVTLADITGIGVYQGPGSFTGLRIGLTVLNTIADSQQVPIVGVQGEQWQSVALARLQAGDNDKIVLPFYGSEAHITTPRK
jgi:tRNA threonylcarbamoyladenosine biosynthesis protein TsaB